MGYYFEGQIVCDYLGEIIDDEERNRWEIVYFAKGISYRIIDLPTGSQYLDGQCNQHGHILNLEDNPAAAMNHSKLSPNCKLKVVDGHYIMVALTGIPTGMECKWNYGDRRKDLDPWMYIKVKRQRLLTL